MEYKEKTNREKLEDFYNHVSSPNGIMSQYSLNQIKFAIDHASDESITTFVKWLDIEHQDIPEPIALENINSGRFTYFENFGDVSENNWVELTVFVPDDDADVEDAINTEIDVQLPFGLDSNQTCIYYSQGKWYVTTDFAEDGEPGKNPIIAVAKVEIGE